MALSERLRSALNHAFRGARDTGPKAGPGRHAMRLLLIDAEEAGLSEEECLGLLNPYFYRGINDPRGGGGLLDDLTAGELHELAAYAVGCEKMSATESQAAFFHHFDGVVHTPNMLARYQELAG